MKKESYPIIGMHCASCKVMIERGVRELPGIKAAQVNYASEQLNIEYDDSKTNLEKIKHAVSSAGGYTLVDEHNTESADGHHHHTLDEIKLHELHKLTRDVIFCGLGALPFAALMLYMLAQKIFMLPMLNYSLLNFGQFFFVFPLQYDKNQMPSPYHALNFCLSLVSSVA